MNYRDWIRSCKTLHNSAFDPTLTLVRPEGHCGWNAGMDLSVSSLRDYITNVDVHWFERTCYCLEINNIHANFAVCIVRNLKVEFCSAYECRPTDVIIYVYN